MRRIRYGVAASLDGYIAGPNGESDWIVMDPEIDFAELFRQFDTALMGRGTYEALLGTRKGFMPPMKTFVFSGSLQPSDFPDVTIVSGNGTETIAFIRSIRSQPGKDVWLVGGGKLFQSLAKEKLVDTVEVMIVPILLGGGVPLLPSPSERIRLKLTSQRVSKNGIVILTYEIL